MLSCLIIGDEYRFKELEEHLLAHDFIIKFTDQLNELPIRRLEFEHDIVFLLKEPLEDEISTILRLSKIKVFLCQPNPAVFLEKSKRNEHWLNKHDLRLDDLMEVFDYERNIGKADKVLLSAASMRGRIEYFKGVEKIAMFEPFHLHSENWETILNGNKSAKAMLGDLAVRTGKDITLSQRKDNLIFFAGDVLSNEPMKYGDNGKFLLNLLGSMLGGAELL